jgi:hypothetical protein
MSTADLAALESVDEEVVLYAAPGADPRLFTAGNASARAAAEAGLVQRIRAVSERLYVLLLHLSLTAQPCVGLSWSNVHLRRCPAADPNVTCAVPCLPAEGPGRAATAAVCRAAARSQLPGARHTQHHHRSDPLQAAGTCAAETCSGAEQTTAM